MWNLKCLWKCFLVFLKVYCPKTTFEKTCFLSFSFTFFLVLFVSVFLWFCFVCFSFFKIIFPFWLLVWFVFVFFIGCLFVKQRKNHKTTEKKNDEPYQNPGWTQMLGKGNQYLPLIRHPACYSYIQDMFDTSIRR